MTNREGIKRQLSLMDSTAIIVGIIIGATFYKSSPFIARCTGSAGATFAAWTLGAFIALVGAMCYAELASTYPQEGGEYVYLTRAFGRFWGFLFAWGGFWVIRPASIGALAIVFATYAHKTLSLGKYDGQIYALGSVILLTLLNIRGVQVGKWTQNILTLTKVVGLLAVFVVGFTVARSVAAPTTQPIKTDFFLAMILIMWTYGGWNEMANVAAEVRNPERNILRALVLGTLATAAIYILGTGAFFSALGYTGAIRSDAIAADVLRLRFASGGSTFISALIAVTCLGANNGMIFTSARVYYALGVDHRLYHWLGEWNQRTGTPVRALLAQGVVTLVLTAIIGRTTDGFERLVVFTAPTFWFFLLLTAVSLFVLRVKDRGIARPYRVTFYPFTPLVLLLACGFMLYRSVKYARENMASDVWIMVVVMAVGVVVAILSAGHNREPLDPLNS